MNGLLKKGDQFFAKHSIRKKIGVSFALFVSVLIGVGVIGLTSMQANKTQLGVLVNDVQPAVLQSLNIVDELDRASASLGFYLLSKEEVHKKDYLAYMENAQLINFEIEIEENISLVTDYERIRVILTNLISNSI